MSLAGIRRDAGVSVALVGIKLFLDIVQQIKLGDHGAAYIVPSLLMRGRAQATVRLWKKRPELQAHSRFTIQDACGLPVATGAVS